MEQGNKPSKSDSFFSYIKKAFYLLLFIQIASLLFSSFKSGLVDTFSPKTHIGCLSINGSITDASFYIKKIDEFSKDPEIKGLLLKINSPGGYTGSSEAVFNELKRFGKKLPIVAVIENVGASGAYYIACAAQSIIASPLSTIGSVGVFLELPNVKDLLTSWKIQYRYVQTGTYKTVGSVVQEISQDEIAYLQKLSDDTYDQFVKDVALCRKLEAKDHKIWADGKIFSGNQALKLKLIDKLGSYSDALDEMKRLAKITEEIKLVHPKRPTNWVRMLTSDDESGDQGSMADSFALFLSTVYNKVALQQNSIQVS